MRRLIFLVVYLATLLAVATPASAMDPQFFDDLNLKNDRHTVAAGGPCHWEAGDAWAEIKNVTIEQGGVVASSGTAHDPRAVALGAGAGVLKVAGALLALALVRPWGRAVPRRLLLGAAWAASLVLTGYGGLLVAVGALVLSRVISPSGPVDRTVLRWHVLFWDLWFVVWGLLLGVAAWRYRRESRDRTVP